MNKYTVYKLLSVGMGLIFLAFSSFASASPSTCTVPGEISSISLNTSINLSNAINTITFVPIATIVIPKGAAQCEGGATNALTVGIYNTYGNLMALNGGDPLINAMTSSSNMEMSLVIGKDGQCMNAVSYTEMNTDSKNESTITVCLKITSLSTPPVGQHYTFHYTLGYVALTNSSSSPSLPDWTHVVPIDIYGFQDFAPFTCWNSGESNVTLPATLASEYIGKAGSTISSKVTSEMSFGCNISPDISYNIEFSITAGSISGADIITSNPDIAVRIFDKNGTTITADGKRYPMVITGTAHSVGSPTYNTIPLSFASVAVTGNKPAVGSYQAIATISLYFP
ncbi:fimbrial protein [Hafnia paralvei]|uniref:Fimbrial-type adhesion domain-containing protein n=1 Tax=Hafnia paralvei TaxID=546367 RepID=A0A4V2J6H4_9GAMM|nr:fimbrial protein [Hafnia paralvei]TBM21015.1 hypothetical protein EYY89_21760 [Hafnia paralvei]